MSKYKVEFNEAGNVKVMVFYDSRTGGIAYQRYFDGAGSSVKPTKKIPQELLRSEYSRDAKGNRVTTVFLGSRVRSRSVYSPSGRSVTVYQYDVRGGLASTVAYRYDAHANLVEETRYKDGSLEKFTRFRYDSKGNKTEELRQNAKGVVTSRQRFKYDERNNLVLSLDSNFEYVGGVPAKRISEDTFSRTFVYDKFDKKGNWLQQSVTVDNKPLRIVKREIEYYK